MRRLASTAAIETGGIAEMLAPLVSEALADAQVSQQIAALTAETLASPEVGAALNSIGWKLAAWSALGVASGIFVGLWLRRVS